MASTMSDANELCTGDRIPDILHINLNIVSLAPHGNSVSHSTQTVA